MKKIECVIMDWAGTAVDYGCFAPVAAFLKAFAEKGLTVTMEEARGPMGMTKIDHIRELFKLPSVTEQFKQNYNRNWTEEDVVSIYKEFEKHLFASLEEYTTPIPGVIEVIEKLKRDGIKIGSTTGYTTAMMDIVLPGAAAHGYTTDNCVTSNNLPAGRPQPYMIYQNMIDLAIPSVQSVIKYGDTIADIKEGVNAGVWTVGVILGSNEMGLTQEETGKLPAEELNRRMAAVRKRMYMAGAHYVVNTIAELPEIIEIINHKMNYTIMRPDLLLTPGPLTTSESVKTAMMTDWCTWDEDYNVHIVEEIRKGLVQLATRKTDEYTSILMQGSGTYCVEATLGSVITPKHKLLILSNGAYGERMGNIAEYHGMNYDMLAFDETEQVSVEYVDDYLAHNAEITHVAVVHCETTTGILNPLKEIAHMVKMHGKKLIVDAMSSFGGVPLDVEELGIDFMISSANKCIQGVPGFGFIIARKSELQYCKGVSKSLSLDIYDQWDAMEKGHGKWRFTSPTHVVRAFKQAMDELAAEGGVEARHARYCRNHDVLVEGMRSLGFKTLLKDEVQSPVITSFLYPDKEFDFKEFYHQLKEKGFVIYPGKISQADTFRIGNIGDVFPEDFSRLIEAIKTVAK